MNAPLVVWLAISTIGVVYAALNLYDSRIALARARSAVAAGRPDWRDDHVYVARMWKRRAAVQLLGSSLMLGLGVAAGAGLAHGEGVVWTLVAIADVWVVNIFMDRRQARIHANGALARTLAQQEPSS